MPSKVKSQPKVEDVTKEQRQPKNWPEDITFLTEPTYSAAVTPENKAGLSRAAAADASLEKVPSETLISPCRLVEIRTVRDEKHPACGQRGLFASENLEPDLFICLYLGHVHTNSLSDTDPHSDYDLAYDRELGLSIDSARFGNESRFINDYRGIAERSNAEFRDCLVQVKSEKRADGVKWERRVGIFVLSAGKALKRQGGIKAGEEVLVNYGKGFWEGRLVLGKFRRDDNMGIDIAVAPLLKTSCLEQVKKQFHDSFSHYQNWFQALRVDRESTGVLLDEPRAHSKISVNFPTKMESNYIGKLEARTLQDCQPHDGYHQALKSESMSVCSPEPRQQRESIMPDFEATSPIRLSPLWLDFSFAARDPTYDSSGPTTPLTLSTPISNVSEAGIEEHRSHGDLRRGSHVEYNMNENLKSSLTNLLSSPAVRENDQMRAWVQTRLMEAERERKSQRRKRLSVVSVPPSPSEAFVRMDTLLSRGRQQSH